MQFQQVSFQTSFGTADQLPPSTLPEVVFSGRSNVGKSSLINKIFNRNKLARVSSTPGKTITINFFSCGGLHFVDLPGYGYAKRSAGEIERWGRMIETYFNSGRRIELVFQLIDFRHKASKDDIRMLDFLSEKQIPFVIVFTKCDKLNKTETLRRMEQIGEELAAYDADAVLFSALTGQGTQEIRKMIELIDG